MNSDQNQKSGNNVDVNKNDNKLVNKDYLCETTGLPTRKCHCDECDYVPDDDILHSSQWSSKGINY